MFQNNRNKQKTNRNSSKFVKNINLFNSPYYNFCLFRLFRYRSETSKQTKTNPKKIFLVLWKSKPKNNRNRLSFGSSNREKNHGFEDSLKENVFWRFFRFVSWKFCLFRLFRYWSETPKQTEKNVFWFRETKQKTTETDGVSFCFGSNRKKKLIVRRTPYCEA